MKLIELYLDEIRHHLPPKNRDDILKEIRSTLMDMIEDRNPTPGQNPDKALIKDILMEFGSPREVARQYGAKNYLIGPRYFPIYLQVLRIVLIIIAALNILGLVVTIISQTPLDSGLLETVLEIVGGLFSSLFTGFGIVTLSFASIERTTPKEWKFKVDQQWTPDDLLKYEDKQRVKISGLAVEITLSLIFIVFINFFYDRIGIYYLSGSDWVSAPILNENLPRYIPWITAYALLDIALNLYLIRKGFWDKYAAIGKVLINAFTIAINFAILTGPDIITVSASALQALNFDTSISPQALSQTLNTILNVLLGLAIFGSLVDSIKRLYETFIKDRHTSIQIQAD